MHAVVDMADASAVERHHSALAPGAASIEICVRARRCTSAAAGVDEVELVSHEVVRAASSPADAPLRVLTALGKIIVQRTQRRSVDRAVEVEFHPDRGLRTYRFGWSEAHTF